MSRWENQVTNREIKEMRRFFVDQFLKSYSQQPEEILLDIDGWDALTHGHQQLSLFHGYYGHYIYFPVLINEASSGYPLVLQLRAGNSHSGKGVAGIVSKSIVKYRQTEFHFRNSFHFYFERLMALLVSVWKRGLY